MSFVYIIFFRVCNKSSIIPVSYLVATGSCRSPRCGICIIGGHFIKIGRLRVFTFLTRAIPYWGCVLFCFCFNIGPLAVIYGSLVTCRQVDLKRVVAYSSVAHMGVVVLGLFSLTSEGEIGGIYLMFAHGLVSPGLFIAVTCLYDRYNTRLIRYYRGI